VMQFVSRPAVRTSIFRPILVAIPYDSTFGTFGVCLITL